MRALVTGASGRVGRRLAAALLARGDGVTGLDAAPARLEHPHYRHVQAGLQDAEAAASAAADVDAVLHIGALMSWHDEDNRALHEANVDGTFNLLEAVARRRCRFIFASSGEVYPESKPRTLPIDETHSTEPRSVYGLTKLLGEEMVRGYGRRYDLPFVILRFCHTQDAAELLDPDSFFSGPRFFLRARIRQQETLGNAAAVAALRAHDDGRERLLLARGQDGTPFRMPILETRDLVQGILRALDAEAATGGTFNLHPDAPLRFDELVPRMAALTGLPVAEVRLPGPAVDFHTSNARARAVFGFRPQITTDMMLEEAAAAWRARRAGESG